MGREIILYWYTSLALYLFLSVLLFFSRYSTHTHTHTNVCFSPSYHCSFALSFSSCHYFSCSLPVCHLLCCTLLLFNILLWSACCEQGEASARFTAQCGLRGQSALTPSCSWAHFIRQGESPQCESSCPACCALRGVCVCVCVIGTVGRFVCCY